MKLIRFLPLLFTRFRRELQMVWGVLTHPAPAKAKVAVVLAFTYLVSPVDLVPDFVPILGWLDDAGVLAILLIIAYKLLPAELYNTLRERVNGKTKGRTSETAKREPQIINVTPEK
jgi:uncharacterized membrane protein YkvA (DUF1232 family)